MTVTENSELDKQAGLIASLLSAHVNPDTIKRFRRSTSVVVRAYIDPLGYVIIESDDHQINWRISIDTNSLGTTTLRGAQTYVKNLNKAIFLVEILELFIQSMKERSIVDAV